MRAASGGLETMLCPWRKVDKVSDNDRSTVAMHFHRPDNPRTFCHSIHTEPVLVLSHIAAVATALFFCCPLPLTNVFEVCLTSPRYCRLP